MPPYGQMQGLPPRMPMNGMRMPMQGAPRGAGFGQMAGIRGVRPMGMPMNGMYGQPAMPGMPGVRPMMAPAGVRQPFGVNPNSPYKFNQQVRNVPQHQQVDQLANQFQNQAQISGQHQQHQQQMPPQQQQQQQQQPPAQQAPAEPELTAAVLAAAEPSQQKQMLGERIYPLVNEQIGTEQAGKVTGMLLEIENFELLKLIDEPALLKEKVSEAMNVLKEHADK
jgi:polyadenylate-binding protein